MTNSADIHLGGIIERLGGAVLRTAESYDDNALEARAMDAVAHVLAGQEYTEIIEDLPVDHPVRMALSTFASAIQRFLDDQA